MKDLNDFDSNKAESNNLDNSDREDSDDEKSVSAKSRNDAIIEAELRKQVGDKRSIHLH